MAALLHACTPGECGCCEGLSRSTPKEVENRPGLGALDYRVGSHADFKATLLERLSAARQLALRGLRTREDDDFTIALLDAFSAMADVLTFYSERIAQEAFLRTATERRSVLELARLIGYRLRPGVAASTSLAFTVDDAPGAFGATLAPPTAAQVVPEIPPPVIVGAGTRVQSIPGPGEKPQTFETSSPVEARAQWNAIPPRLTQPQQIATSAKTVVLDGGAAAVKRGDVLLLLEGSEAKDGSALATVRGVATSPDGKTTVLELDTPIVTAAGSPATSPPALPAGTVEDIARGSPLTVAVVDQILGRSWEAETLAALAAAQDWPLAELELALNERTSGLKVPSGSVHVFRQRASPFGYNAPIHGSLPPILRFDSTFQGAGGNVTVTAPYKDSWENRNLETEANPGQGLRTVHLDAIYPDIAPRSWVALQARPAAGQGEPARAVGKVVSRSEVSRSDFTLSARISILRVEVSGLENFGIRNTTVLCQSEPLPLAPVAVTDAVAGRQITLGSVYLGLARTKRIALSGVRSDLPGVTDAELRTLDRVTVAGGLTILELDQALEHSYVRETVRINANVAAGDHGETVQEILGSGDATEPFQSFTLQQPPLTYVSAATATGTRSTLEVRVDDVLWHEADSFFGRAPDERIYVTRESDDGKTTVTFGDGLNGARLPTGQQNVKAVYRRGIGSGGLVRANQLSQLLSRPLGIRAVTNPVPATGAADAERLADARRNCTLTILTLGRVVSLQDFEDFARAFAGIEKAAANWTWSGEQRVVLLTVAGVDGAVVGPGDDPYQHLLAALSNLSEPGVRLQLMSYEPVAFRIAGIVTVEKDSLPDAIRALVESALRDEFSFDRREFGQPVHRSELVAAIQRVKGVVEVELVRFHRSDRQPSLEEALPSAAPQAKDGGFSGAELVTLDPRPLELEYTR